jgi:hypothetical protein
MVDFLLKEDGDFLLLETGDKIILEDGTPATPTGVIIEGTHATVDLRGIGRKKKRVLVYTLEAYSQITRQTQAEAQGRTLKEYSLHGTSRISRITENTISTRTKPHEYIAEAKVYRNDPRLTDIHTRASKASAELKEQRKDNLRRLYEEYRDEFEE